MGQTNVVVSETFPHNYQCQDVNIELTPDLNLDKEFIENMISRRQEAKKNKDFELADKIRDELFKQGIVLEDTINGTTWKKN